MPPLPPLTIPAWNVPRFPGGSQTGLGQWSQASIRSLVRSFVRSLGGPCTDWEWSLSQIEAEDDTAALPTRHRLPSILDRCDPFGHEQFLVSVFGGGEADHSDIFC